MAKLSTLSERLVLHSLWCSGVEPVVTIADNSDLDIAAWWSGNAPAAWDVAVRDGVDLVVLNAAPLELAGRIALEGVVLFDDDPPARALGC